MNGKILAAIDNSTAAAPVLAMAKAMASLLKLSLDAIHVREAGKRSAESVARRAGVDLRLLEGEPMDILLTESRDETVEMVVLGMRGHPSGPRPAGHVATAIIEAIDKPAIVVPPDWPATGDARPVRRALLPLEGTPETSAAIAGAVQVLAEAGVDLIGVHVFDAATRPAFWGRSGHAEQSWAAEFVCRWCSEHGVDLHLRRGPAAATISEVAADQQADLVAFGWTQNLKAGRADVVREALNHTSVPLLLIPVSAPTDNSIPHPEMWHRVPI